jgi:hypothetical protein
MKRFDFSSWKNIFLSFSLCKYITFCFLIFIVLILVLAKYVDIKMSSLFFLTQLKVVLVIFILVLILVNQTLVGSVVINAEFGIEDHCSIPHNCDREETRTS